MYISMCCVIHHNHVSNQKIRFVPSGNFVVNYFNNNMFPNKPKKKGSKDKVSQCDYHVYKKKNEKQKIEIIKTPNEIYATKSLIPLTREKKKKHLSLVVSFWCKSNPECL